MDNFHDKRTGIGLAELSSLDAVGRIRELFSEHLIGATLGTQKENNSEGAIFMNVCDLSHCFTQGFLSFFPYHTINTMQHKTFFSREYTDFFWFIGA